MCSDQHVKYGMPDGFTLTGSLLLDYHIQQYIQYIHHKLIQFSFVSSCYLQNIKVRQLPEPELEAIFKGYSKWELAFCHAGDADIQNCAPARNVFTGNFLRTNYYYG